MQLSTMPTAQVTAATIAQQPLQFQLNGFCFTVSRHAAFAVLPPPIPTPLLWGRCRGLSHYTPSACPASSKKRKLPPRDHGSLEVLMFNGIPC